MTWHTNRIYDPNCYTQYERCIKCDALTDKAGKGDDSYYINANNGPYCETCFDEQTAIIEAID